MGFHGRSTSIVYKIGWSKRSTETAKDALMLLFLPKQILFSNHSLLLGNRESLEGD
jgi:hypothetical protein